MLPIECIEFMEAVRNAPDLNDRRRKGTCTDLVLEKYGKYHEMWKHIDDFIEYSRKGCDRCLYWFWKPYYDRVYSSATK